jgi:monoamine oxidase
MTSRGSVDVVVVGAGISGLAAAHGLPDAGLSVAILEARERPGGRLLGSPFDLGASWFWPGEERVHRLTDRWGIETFDQHRAGDAVIDDLHGVQRYPGNPIDVPARRIVGGTATLARVLTDALPPDVLHLETPVKSITDDLTVVTPEREWHPRHVVLALPPALAAATISLPTQLSKATVEVALRTPVWMGNAVKFVAHYREPFWRGAGLAGAGMSRRGPLQEIHDMSGPNGEPAALFGFARPESLHADVETDIRAQLVRMYGTAADDPLESSCRTGARRGGRRRVAYRHRRTTRCSGTARSASPPWEVDCTGHRRRPPRRMPATSRERWRRPSAPSPPSCGPADDDVGTLWQPWPPVVVVRPPRDEEWQWLGISKHVRGIDA